MWSVTLDQLFLMATLKESGDLNRGPEDRFLNLVSELIKAGFYGKLKSIQV